ncbi:MAG: ABC transporter permease subunit [Lentisphaeria bacterium]|nr:ABC transporter permease subunit [Lentisphaeria bacterium]
MSIISTIGRKSLKVRCLIWSIYLVLTLGALTMIYPFWLMISGTGKSSTDVSELKLIPSYLVDDDAYYRKTVASLFNELIVSAQMLYNMPLHDFRQLPVPQDKKEKLCKEWEEFLDKKNFPFYYYFLGHSHAGVSNNTRPENFRHYKDALFEEFDGDLSAMNDAKGTEFATWNALMVNENPFAPRRTIPNPTVRYNEEWYMHKSTAPKHHRVYVNASGFFKGSFIYPQYSKDVATYNKSHKTSYKDYADVRLSRRFPANATAKEKEDWEFFVREILNLFWIRVDASQNPAYRKFIAAKYGTVASLNKIYGTKYKSFAEVKLPTEIPAPYHGALVSDFGDYLKGWLDPQTKILHKAPAKNIYLCSVEFLFRDYLKDKFKTVAAMNKALGTNYKSFDVVDAPQWEYHYTKIMADKKHQRWEFATRNFKTVFAYIALQGRGVINTVIYCALAVLCALTFNPLAAYALSRFQLPSTYKILLFLMLTMAFPQMVTQIPNFLMMRELGLLNTFGALVLPGLANGYSIFLLKGFFDSLPKELYESAMLDGASETRIFLQITMSLSKPILAVIALNAFTHAYSNFMMALLICQDQKMWTLMPWLYQLQQSSCQAVIYSSLIIASIPTFLIFMLCQNVIMRGIVVPVEK